MAQLLCTFHCLLSVFVCDLFIRSQPSAGIQSSLGQMHAPFMRGPLMWHCRTLGENWASAWPSVGHRGRRPLLTWSLSEALARGWRVRTAKWKWTSESTVLKVCALRFLAWGCCSVDVVYRSDASMCSKFDSWTAPRPCYVLADHLRVQYTLSVCKLFFWH